MSKRSISALLLVGLSMALLAAGCTSGKGSPTPAPTETESILFVVVTTTSQPTIEATQILEPTITPLATFTPVGLDSPTPTAQVTVTPAARKTTEAITPAAITPKPAATAKPAATNPPPPPVPSQYSAPEIIGPAQGTLFNDGNAIPLQFRAVGPLPSDVCYEVYVQFINPNATPGNVGNLWSFNCGDQNASGAKLTLSVTKFRGDTFNYIALRDTAEGLAPTDYLTVMWTVTVGKRDGTLLSPISNGFPLQFQPR